MTDLSTIPLAERTMEICTKAVEENWKQLLYVPKQTFEMCVSAAKQDTAALTYVDPEFRTNRLLATVGEADDDLLSDESLYTRAEGNMPSGDETTYLTITGKGKGESLEAAFNIIRRCVESDIIGADYVSIWSNEESEIGCLEMSISEDKTSFVLDYFWDGDHYDDLSNERIEDLFGDCLDYLDNDDGLPRLFTVCGIDRPHEQLRWVHDENLEWHFEVGDGEDKMYETRDLFEEAAEKFRQLRHLPRDVPQNIREEALLAYQEAEAALYNAMEGG